MLQSTVNFAPLSELFLENVLIFYIDILHGRPLLFSFLMNTWHSLSTTTEPHAEKQKMYFACICKPYSRHQFQMSKVSDGIQKLLRFNVSRYTFSGA